ncbi:MAG: IS630 family transposase, partial [Chloroflexota bacterium]|nr:IS630 family transposase [Chloroflexota bacterium]
KHGSWLNMAEFELCSLNRQCLNRRIPDKETLEREADAWQRDRKVKGTKVDWRFTTADARIKLNHLYPVVEI